MEALCKFCGAALHTLTKKNFDSKAGMQWLLTKAVLHVIFACPGKRKELDE